MTSFEVRKIQTFEYVKCAIYPESLKVLAQNSPAGVIDRPLSCYVIGKSEQLHFILNFTLMSQYSTYNNFHIKWV